MVDQFSQLVRKGKSSSYTFSSDKAIANQANEILIELMLAGPTEKAAAVVTEVNIKCNSHKYRIT